MTRSRGALSKTMLDRNYPHQVMLKNDATYRICLWAINRLASELGAYALGHSFHFVEEHADYSVYCFSTRDSAQTFLNNYGGEWLSSVDRKKGNWRPRSPLASTSYPK